MRSIPAPRFKVLKGTEGGSRWALYFIYAPEGRISPHHSFTIRRLREQRFSLLVVVSSDRPTIAIQQLASDVDCLIWKDIPGFDFSAYVIGLHWLAKHAKGSDVFVMNDSVFGPFADIPPLMRRARWRLTGLTGSGILENHLQSYAFIVRNIDKMLLLRLASVFNVFRAFNSFQDVVMCQELRLARVASHATTVGAFWYAGMWPRDDPTLDWPTELLEEGFPFIKKSLLGKNADRQPEGRVAGLLSDRGYAP